MSGGSSVEMDGSEVLTMTSLVKGALRLVPFLLFGMELKDVMALTLTEFVITVFDKKIKRLIGQKWYGEDTLGLFLFVASLVGDLCSRLMLFSLL